MMIISFLRHNTLKACKKFYKNDCIWWLHSKLVINEVEKYVEIIIGNDIKDLQNKLSTLTFHAIFRSKIDLKVLFNEVRRCVKGRFKW